MRVAKTFQSPCRRSLRRFVARDAPGRGDSTLKSALHIAMALGAGAASGLALSRLDVPIAWMLGALVSTAVLVSVTGVPLDMPRRARDVVRPIIGVLAGSAFSPAILDQVTELAAIVGLVIAFGAVMTLVGYLVFKAVAGLDRPTAFFAAAPAGLTEMSLVGEALGGNLRTLFLIHTVRVVAVVFTVPHIAAWMDPGAMDAVGDFTLPVQPGLLDWVVLVGCGVGGYAIGQVWRFPSGIMIASMLLTGMAQIGGLTAAAPPDWAVIVVQTVLGCMIGARFAGIRWREAVPILAPGLLWAVVLIGAATATAVALSIATGLPVAALLLALAPGGMAEIALIAYALGVDMLLVMSCQVLRNASTMVIAPALFRILRL